MNSLIAEFMGFQHTTLGWYDAEETLVNAENDNTFDELKFKTDWNWLMPVVEKTTCMHEFQEDYPSNSTFWELYNQVSIEATYKAVVDFIKWYNKQK